MPDIIQIQDNRRVFVDTLNELAKNDDKIIVLIPDVGFNYLNDSNLNFKVINTGVTEQSTVLIATAMALSGLKPYVYSMINFVLFRPGEMVRNGIVCHKANVKLIGVKGSSSYKFLGFSHNLLHEDEDKNFCANIGLESWEPTTLLQVRGAIENSYASKLPCYIRI